MQLFEVLIVKMLFYQTKKTSVSSVSAVASKLSKNAGSPNLSLAPEDVNYSFLVFCKHGAGLKCVISAFCTSYLAYRLGRGMLVTLRASKVVFKLHHVLARLCASETVCKLYSLPAIPCAR